MKNILMIGVGMSSKHLVDYILAHAPKLGWFVTIGDVSPDVAISKAGENANARAIWLDVTKPNDRKAAIIRADLVISLLPAHLHLLVAQDCIRNHKKLVTSSHVERELFRLGDEVRDQSLVFMSEMVLAPGLDRISAQQKIDEVKEKGGKILSFSSYTGGLISPECNNNPWKHKLTWNPRNFVLSGQGTAQYLEDGKRKYIPYSRLFSQTRKIDVPSLGEFEVYANRDSLLNRSVYGLDHVPSILRGTIRYPGFCKAWSKLVRTGLTDGSYPIHGSDDLTYYDLMEAYLSKGKSSAMTFRERVAAMLKVEVDSEIMAQFEWLGLFKKQKINLEGATPSLMLENLLREKWMMEQDDKDMVILQHEIVYKLTRSTRKLTSTIIIEGEHRDSTAMSKFIGLPTAIFARKLLEGEINEYGASVPIKKNHYVPVLEELKSYGISAVDVETAVV